MRTKTDSSHTQRFTVTKITFVTSRLSKNRLNKAIVKEGEFIFTHVGEIKLTLKAPIGGRGSPAFKRTQP
jgi:hypothetical protein